MTDDPEKFRKMDKKNSFPAFSANINKSLTLDNSSKATVYTRQDGTSGSQVSKVQHRTPSRYKGNLSGNSNNSRNEFNSRSKQFLPKGRGNFDKRGKPRGGGGASTAESVVDRKNEPGSLQSPGGKKQNFDDLWGFHFAPRGARDHGYTHELTNRSHPPGGGHWRHNHMSGQNRVKYAKDYLLANCQFLVRFGEDYTVYIADPNLLVTWDLIEQVRIRFDGEMPKCPICLDFPVAAKITKCGHIYCWSCFLHYLALSDNKVRTCPICYEPVSKKDLKSVSLLPLEAIQIGSKIEMRLMSRMKDSCIAYPYEKFPGWESKFCKILQITPEAIIHNILNRERTELDFVFCTDPTAPEVCFIQAALNELVEREIALSAKQIEFASLDSSTNGLFPPDIVFGTVVAHKTEEGIETTTIPDQPTLAPEKETSPRRKTRNDSVSSNSSVGILDEKQGDGQGHCYFYQILDGRNVFLHPMNMAMLWRELGPDPEKWPQVLTFEVIDIESRSATDDVRKRMKLVRHLPKNTTFELVEVSMEEWGISPQVYADFSSQLKQREQRRKNRAKEERIFEKKQREREAIEFSKLKQLPMITSAQEFPAFEPLTHPPIGLASFPEELVDLDGAIAIEPAEETHSEESLHTEPYATMSSFAQIAGKAPIKKSPTFPLSTRSMWGTGATPSASTKTPTLHPGRHSDSENECEDYIPVPDYRTSVSDAIEKAMAGLALAKSEAQGSGDADMSADGLMSNSGNKKKKNKKGTVVFALGMGPF